MALRIEGGNVLLPEGLATIDLMLDHGRIAGIGSTRPSRILPGLTPPGLTPISRTFDARGLHVLPGIVDLHGDAFERQMQPRPGVPFPTALAFRETERQLLANGITTAFHAVTLGWEPGLRGANAWRTTLDVLAAGTWSCDMRVHMRWELHNLDALPTALADVAAGRVGMVTFNDHTPEIVRKLEIPEKAAAFSARAGIPAPELRAMAAHALSRTPEVPAAANRLAAAAHAAGIPVASHDDATIATRHHYRALGARVCEFPMAQAVGEDARDHGEPVVMGCPNVVRGGSHLGWAGAGALAEQGIATILCSDYFYPAMTAAALRLASGLLGLARAWALISANPAIAAGLHDRGCIALGLRADLVLLDSGTGEVVATVCEGRVAYAGTEGWARMG